MKNTHLYILTALLTLLGVGLFGYKVWVLNFPINSNSVTSIWTIEAAFSFQNDKRPGVLSVFVPKSTSRFSIIDENFISGGFSLTTNITEGNRLVTWTGRKPEGQINLYYRATVRQIAPGDVPPLKQPRVAEHGFEGAYLEAARTILAQAGTISSDSVPLLQTLAGLLSSDSPDDNIRLLLEPPMTEHRRAETLVRLLALNGDIARLVNGIDLTRRSSKVHLVHWLEVFEKQGWHPYDAASGQAEVPGQYLPWWFGSDSLARLEGGEDLQTSLSVQPSEEAAIQSALDQLGQEAPFLRSISLFSLPLAAQLVFRVLLLVPIGALIVVLLRNVVGLRTFGTFMPVLVALAFRETGLLWGTALFCAIVLTGLTVRLYLDRLKLLLVPRLAAILTVVILLMAGVSLISHGAGLGNGLSAALFPMVIMTMTIERMSIIWDELGAKAAVQQGIGTLLVSAVIFAVIYSEALAHLVFVFPELLLVVLAAIILLGRYTGYRLLELSRFRSLIDNGS